MPFSPAAALWNNRETLADAMPEIGAVRTALETATGGPRDFMRQQWLQLISVVYDFKPDLIIELGRGYGNSTCAMSVAMKMLRPAACRLLSLCDSRWFDDISRPHIEASLADETLFAALESRNADIARYDFSPDIARAERVFVFWDAHGYDLAVALQAGLLRALAAKAHLVVVHDMADLKYLGDDHRRYENHDVWKGTGSAPAKYVLGDVGSQFDEGVALVDFLGRNGLAFRSAESSYFPELTDQQAGELGRRFGADFSRFGFWYHFSLNEAAGRPLTFPTPPTAPAVVAAPSLPSTDRPAPKRRSLLKRLLRRKRRKSQR